jgi:hypothetical protein
MFGESACWMLLKRRWQRNDVPLMVRQHILDGQPDLFKKIFEHRRFVDLSLASH